MHAHARHGKMKNGNNNKKKFRDGPGKLKAQNNSRNYALSHNNDMASIRNPPPDAKSAAGPMFLLLRKELPMLSGRYVETE